MEKKRLKRTLQLFFFMENLQEHTCIILLVSFQQTENTETLAADTVFGNIVHCYQAKMH